MSGESSRAVLGRLWAIAWDDLEPAIERVCRGAVRWAALRAEGKVKLPELPDPYEPILLMFERGRGYSVGQFSERRGGFAQWEGLGLDAPKIELAPDLSNINEAMEAAFQELRSNGLDLK